MQHDQPAHAHHDEAVEQRLQARVSLHHPVEQRACHKHKDGEQQQEHGEISMGAQRGTVNDKRLSYTTFISLRKTHFGLTLHAVSLTPLDVRARCAY